MDLKKANDEALWEEWGEAHHCGGQNQAGTRPAAKSANLACS